ncbi:MAG: DUF4154 domain-containing protein [Bacteroidetes bacterium]|jgi:hypothetical protein|nr:DUF4154 domain-containing protein [Bacteroidota bacterium]
MKRFLLVIFALNALVCSAQQVPEFKEKDTSAMIKASYIYNFTKYIDWPDSYKQGNFVISVMGSSGLHQELVKKYSNKQVGQQQIEIRKISKTLNISKCHVLYISREYANMLPQITESLEGKPTLVVTNLEGTLEKGAMLNFLFEDNHWKFDLNMKNAEQKQLFIGSTLKSLARSIK